MTGDKKEQQVKHYYISIIILLIGVLAALSGMLVVTTAVLLEVQKLRKFQECLYSFVDGDVNGDVNWPLEFYKCRNK